MDRLGPFEPAPALAVAVSGGADSMALAVLARDWSRRHGGSVHALVVDHGLRAASAQEASITIERLGGLGIPARVLSLTALLSGPALAERARIMRYRALAGACRDGGLLHLLLGHHAADQAETLAMRVLRGSQTHGLAGMAALRETATLRLLRPLLGVQPEELRRYLTGLGIGWVEDPSNRDFRALRPRLRRGFAAHGAHLSAIGPAMTAAGVLRAREETLIAAELATRADIRPEGFAILSPGPISAAALSSLVRTIAGADYPPSSAQLAALAMRPSAATIAGVRLIEVPTGLLIVREEAAIADPVEVSRGAVWDNRFRVTASHGVPSGCTVGKLGDDAAHVRGHSDLPSVILRTAPAIRVGGKLASVPHIGYVSKDFDAWIAVLFSPPEPVSGASFVPAARV